MHRSFFDGQTFKDIADNTNVLVTVSQQITETNFEPRMFIKMSGVCKLVKIDMNGQAKPYWNDDEMDIADWPLWQIARAATAHYPLVPKFMKDGRLDQVFIDGHHIYNNTDKLFRHVFSQLSEMENEYSQMDEKYSIEIFSLAAEHDR